MNATASAAPHAVRGLALLSGGLDSRLAVCVLRAQGCHMEGVVFDSPFFNPAPARAAAHALGITLHEVDFTADIMELVRRPPHGYGGCLNPCIDCHARMVRRAAERMAAGGFDFVATGEVLNQRPMSQNRRALGIVAQDSGIPDRLLRPLSAQLLEPTRPELEGRVDRTRLLALQSRSRKPQMELAVQYGLRDYPTPAGGCLLTESGFCRRLQDLMDHEGLDDPRLAVLLRYGRHFRLPGGAKGIVGRDHLDNQALRNAMVPGDTLMHSINVPGPTLLVPGAASADDLAQARALCAAYADQRPDRAVVVRTRRDDAVSECTVTPEDRARFQPWLR